jgi:hypothetical protein
VRDISVEEPEIEAIVREIYERSAKGQFDWATMKREV